MKKALSFLITMFIIFAILPPEVLNAAAGENTGSISVSSVAKNGYGLTGGSYAIAESSYDDAVQKIKAAIANVEALTIITEYSISVSQLIIILNNEIFTNPSFFYLELCSYSYNSSNIVTKVSFSYGYTMAQIQQMKNEYETQISNALSWVKPGMSDAEKVLAIHDYIILHSIYDYDNYLNNSIPSISYTSYGVLVNGVGVCNGYALAFVDLMTRLGVVTILISSTSMSHTWNMVQIGGEWYHIDLTYDDPVFSPSNSWLNNDYDFEGHVNHQFFLLSDTALAGLGHTGWQPGPHIAGSSIYNGKYADITSGMFYYQGYWYYNNAGNLTRSLFNRSSPGILKAINTNSYLTVFSNEIYYNYTTINELTSQIRKIRFDSSSDTQVITINNTGKDVKEKITELVLINSSLKYTVYRWPNANPKYEVRYLTLTPPPAVSGVANNAFYTTNVTITFPNGLTATLDGNPFNSGNTVSAEGQHTVIVLDSISGLSTSITFTIDKTIPATPTLSANPTTSTTGNVTVTITYPSDAAVKEYKIGNGEWSTYTSALILPANNTISARCKDAAGNISELNLITVNNIASYVRILNDKGAEAGDILPIKVSWFTAYKRISLQLGFTANDSSYSIVEWLSNNPKVIIDKNSGKITNLKTGARSAEIKVILSNSSGSEVTDTVRVVFYKFSWQLKNLSK